MQNNTLNALDQSSKTGAGENENKILPQGLPASEHDKQVKWLKTSILASMSVIFFALAWWLMNAGLNTTQGFVFWLLASLSAAIGISFLAFLAIVDMHKKLFWGVNFAIFALYVLLLPKTVAVVAGGVIFFVLIWFFERHIREDEHSRADFEINRILRSSINLMVYGLLIVLGFNLYNQTHDKFEKNPDIVYNQIGRYAAAGLEYVPEGVGNFSPNQSFDDFITRQTNTQDPAVQESFRQQLEAKFNYKINGNPLLGQVVAGVVAQKVKSVSQNYSKFFPALFALLVVVALRYVAFLFVWLTSIVCWLLFKLLLMLKFFRIEKVQVEVDKLHI